MILNLEEQGQEGNTKRWQGQNCSSWPFLGRHWPPLRCVFESGGPGTAGVFSGECGSAHLQRKRGQSDNQSLGPKIWIPGCPTH